MEKQSDKQRVNINVSGKIHHWYKEKAQEIGVSMSAYMAIALEQHMQNAFALEIAMQNPELAKERATKIKLGQA